MRSSMSHHALDRMKKLELGWLARSAGRWLWLRHGRRLPGLPGGLAPTGPITVNILPTLRCPCRCTMCSVEQLCADTGGAEPSTAVLQGLLVEVRELGALAVSISGGEPLLRSDLPELVATAHSLGLATSVSTNGLLVDHASAEALVAAGLDQITVSLDSCDDHDYRSFRGAPAGVASVIEALRVLGQARNRAGSTLQVVISMAVRADRIDQVAQVMEQGRLAGADAIAFAPAHHITPERITCRAETPFDQAAFEASIRAHSYSGLRVDSSPRYLALFEQAFTGASFPLPCSCGWTMFSVAPDGAIYPCAPWLMRGQPVGRWEPGGLARWWKAPATRQLRQRLAACRACHWNCYAEHSLIFEGQARREAAGP